MKNGSNFLQADERDIVDARAESRRKISRLVNAVSSKQQDKRTSPLNLDQRNQGAHAFKAKASTGFHENIDELEDMLPPPGYAASLMHIRHVGINDTLAGDALRPSLSTRESKPRKPSNPSFTSRADRDECTSARLSRTTGAMPSRAIPTAGRDRSDSQRLDQTARKAPASRVGEKKEENNKSHADVKSTPLSTAIESMDARAKRAADNRAQLHAAATERVRARQQQLEEENRERERKLAEAHYAMLEERKKQKEAELDEAVRRQEQTKATREKVRRADEFRQFQLLARCAWSPWVRLLEERSLNEQKAANFARDALLQRAWDNFLGYYQAKKLEQYRALAKKQTLATAHYRRMLLKLSWEKWQYLRRIQRSKAIAVQNQFMKFSRLRRAMIAWKVSFEKKLRVKAHLSRRATYAGHKCVWRYYLSRWKHYIEESALEREVEFRTRVTWSKVQTWL